MKIAIKSKFSVGLFVIFSIAFLILNYSVSQKIYENNEKIITQELITIKENNTVLIRQAFMINKYNNEEVYFEKLARDITDELVSVIKSDVGIYSLKGELIYSSDERKFNDSSFKDIDNAVNNKTSYTIKNNDNKAEVFFSYPVIIAGNKVGILRIIKDYSLIYNQGDTIVTFVLKITMMIFTVAFLFSYLLSRNITAPLVELTKATNKAANGDLDIIININRKDEIGELGVNFSIMIDKIDEQIKTIKNDRDSLEQLINHKKHFYDNVTHELKTPLTAIIGYAKMIKENGFTDEEFFQKGTNHIINEGERLHEMVITLLELSKQTSSLEGNFSKVDIGELLKNICEDMIFKAGRYGNTLNLKVEKNLYVNGSSNHLKQVFINIIDNAIKYGIRNAEVRIIGYDDNNFVCIDIINGGRGIPKEDLSKIFTPFYSYDKKMLKEIGSCGLGLSISKEIIEKHKGYIEIESEVNKETSVLIKLPSFKLNN